jgi:DNA-binding protein HU-beta
MSDRQELIEKFAKKANVSKRDTGEFLAIFLEVIQLILARTGEVKLPGFGTFKAKNFPEREGTNPLTGEKVTFAPGVRLSFKPGRPLKEAMMKGSFIAKAEKKRPAKAPKRKK